MTMTAQADLFTTPQSVKPRRVQGGQSSTQVILTAAVTGNAEMFAQIAQLHLPAGCTVADVTYGKGVFWQAVPKGQYQLLFSDIAAKTTLDPIHQIPIQNAIDCRSLPYSEASLDALVLDPPYMEGLFRREISQLAGAGTHQAFRHHYSSSQTTHATDPKWHDAVLDLYLKAGLEARRVVRNGGTIIVKCQDEVSANKQRLTHVEIITAYESLGLYCKDLFVLVRVNRPNVSRLKTQVHGRKNHSYFLVFQKVKTKISNVVRL
jgi:hypothetical protein